MKYTLSKKLHIDSLIALLLFGLFATCVLAVLLTGSEAYRRLTARDQAAYDRRTCVQYVTNKVRQAYAGSAVSVSDFGQSDALTLTQVVGDEIYLTRIYCYDGWLRELFCLQEGDFSPQDGERILQANQLSFTLENGLLSVQLIDANAALLEFKLSIRGGEGAVP